MAVIHILKDGAVVQDIEGHIVTKKDVENVYVLIEQLNKKNRAKHKRKGRLDQIDVIKT